ncbi:phage tail protein [Acidovorax sp. SDU_ACID1]|uniref:phage tail protein n=1 Tax=Acidovorax sp. SDU_ACID1 TaxID=3136632 RepID=UPI003872A936
MALALLAASGSAQAQTPYVSELRAFAYPRCPRNWAPANGALLAVNTNQALSALLGVNYGGNGTVFNLPDLRGRTPMGANGATLPRGSQPGQESTTLIASQLPLHTHPGGQPATTAPATHAAPAARVLAQTQNAGLYVDSADANTTLTTAPAGANMPLPTREPYLVINWCVALTGVWPSSQ